MICLLGVIGSYEHAPSLPSPLDTVEAGALPSGRLCCPHHQQYYHPLRLLPQRRLGLHLPGLYQAFRGLDQPSTARDLPCCSDGCPSIPFPLRRGVLRGCIQNLHPFRGLRDGLSRSALPGSPYGVNISTLQDSLNGADYWVAPPSQRVTPLHHLQSPGSSGSLLRGSLAITTTGLPPDSHQNLARRTNPVLGDGRTRTDSRSYPLAAAPPPCFDLELLSHAKESVQQHSVARIMRSLV